MMGLYFTLYEYYKIDHIRLHYDPVPRYAVSSATGVNPCFAYPCFSFNDADGNVDPAWTGSASEIEKFSSYNGWTVTAPLTRHSFHFPRIDQMNLVK